MKVLVAVASQHGSTQEIAYQIGKVLTENGHQADVKNVETVSNLDDYGAAVVGSAIYSGSWLAAAKDFVDRNSEQLGTMPVWLFSSGPIGKIPAPEKAVRIYAISAKSKAREHRLFGGKVDKSKLNFTQKAVLYALNSGQGDYRDWKEIDTWAADIAAILNKTSATRKKEVLHGYARQP